jgi:colanic acid/amylovoran biosynthesis glycosyltransferase
MRIAYLTGEYPRATDTFIQREVATLREQGVEVHTFSVRRTGDEHMVGPEQKRERDRTFYILPANPLNLLWVHLRLLLGSPSRYFRAIQLAWSTRQAGLQGGIYQLFYFLEAGILAQQILQSKITHLHNHFPDSSGTVAMLAAELGGFTFSFTMHGPYIFFEPHRWRIDEKIKRALFVACISYYCRSQGMVFVPTEVWQRMHIIHCGIDPALFTPVVHQESSKRLLYVGRLSAAKGLPILLESLVRLQRSHPELILTIVGDGPDRAELERMATQFGLNEHVNFVGYQSQAEVQRHIQQSDVFVMSSFAEGIPVVLMEAMAAGLPVVATQIAGISELVENGVNGYLVPPGDAVTLAEHIAKLLADHQLRNQLGAAGRVKVQQDFNIEHEGAWLRQVMAAALQGQVESLRPQKAKQSAMVSSEPEAATTHVS